ncbi:MAG: ABC transporter permease [Candidatus Liptonbacteria bacterium]|nr:ABC transporter permease [Candidatus Liptonbacteria bacterium]
MFTVFSRIIQYGFKNFWRNGWLSAATVAIMVLALIVFTGLILFSAVTDYAIGSIQDKIDISVYFTPDTSEDQILNIKQSLETLAEVKGVEYISRDKALEVFKTKHADDPTISQALVELNTNPLLASLNVKAKDPNQYAAIAEHLSGNSNLKRYIESVSYYKNQVVIERLNSIVRGVNRGGLLLTIFLAIVAGLMIFSTIQLATYSNREEIAIMRVVGASNALVRGPFLIQGIIAGGIAAVVSLVVSLPLVYALAPELEHFVPGLELFPYAYAHALELFFYELCFGIVVATLSSFFAVRRYLKH